MKNLKKISFFTFALIIGLVVSIVAPIKMEAQSLDCIDKCYRKVSVRIYENDNQVNFEFTNICDYEVEVGAEAKFSGDSYWSTATVTSMRWDTVIKPKEKLRLVVDAQKASKGYQYRFYARQPGEYCQNWRTK